MVKTRIHNKYTNPKGRVSTTWAQHLPDLTTYDTIHAVFITEWVVDPAFRPRVPVALTQHSHTHYCTARCLFLLLPAAPTRPRQRYSFVPAVVKGDPLQNEEEIPTV